MKSNYLSLVGLLILLSTSPLIFSDDKVLEKEKTSIDEDKTLSQNDRFQALEDENDNKREIHNPFFRSKYYRKKNSLFYAPYKSNRLERSYPTSRAYHPPIADTNYLREEESVRRFQNRKNFLRYRERQLKRDNPELMQEVDSEDFI